MLTKAQLRELYQAPSERSQKKLLNELEEHGKLFISRSPLVVISTHSETGRCDCSPRGGQPGFVRILSDSQIAIPDFRGNNRLDSLENIVETGEIGCVFLVPGISETLRINGSASVHADPEIMGQFEDADSVRTYILVDIKEVYIHCGKALLRSEIWDASTHVNPLDFPSFGTIFNAHLGKAVLPESHEEIAELYTKR
ncbi:MSMEG_1061 family FMN-dependent PPOX-type flavoprotein [Verrucomicrobiaceae bacterium 227]